MSRNGLASSESVLEDTDTSGFLHDEEPRGPREVRPRAPVSSGRLPPCCNAIVGSRLQRAELAGHGYP